MIKLWPGWLSLQRTGKLYILPTRAGWGFVLLLVLLLLLSINFENNLTFALTFLLTALMIIAILYTYSNLAGVQVACVGAHPCFAGESAGFTLQLSSVNGREHQQIQLSWPEATPVAADLLDTSQIRIELALPTKRRGWCVAPKIRLQTVFPLGLFRCWCYQSVVARALVYPMPEMGGVLPATAGADGQGVMAEQSGSDDFSGLQRFQAGMSPHHVAWKVFARGQGLHAKRYASRQDLNIWLDYASWPEADTEVRLSRLCYWTMKLSRDERPFGLRLPGKILAPSRGEVHRQQVLKSLALFGVEAP
ncbi:DUF58 domain-containing protein [Nitrincola sp.]|uniref:DUF58 domain-containing protein n=1 Tax=Nitrincola sp. TaxID=1926584 RepID=UPI003A92B623